MRRLTVLLGLLAALLVGAASPALAVAPLNVTSRITDQVGALKGKDSDVSAAIDSLQAKKGISEYVVFVSSFDGMTGEQWALTTAQQSGLVNDVVLAVAVGDRHFGVHRGTVSSSEIDEVVVDRVKPKLSDGDWSGAAIALADGLGGSSGSSSGMSSGAVAFLVVLVLILGAGGLYMFGRSRRRRRQELEAAPAPVGPPDPHAGVPTEQLNYRASSALLDLDERVRSAAVNVDYARSYFGEEAVPGFEAGLAQSRDELGKAFTIRQELDDEIPEDEPTQRRMLTELLKLTDAAGERLKSQAAALDELRERERTAPQAAEELARRIAALQVRMPTQEQRLADLQGRYAAGAVSPVTENVREAGVRLAAAAQALELARQDQAAGDVGRSVGRLRGAEDAAGQSATLLDAIDRLATDLATAEQRVASARAETETDLAEARALVGQGDRSGLPPLIARAEAALAAADAAVRPADGALPDPLSALRQLEDADAALEQALSVARDAQTQSRRAAEALDQAMLTARSTLAAAEDFIGTRRGAVGPTARTRLAEAGRHLDTAESLARQDPSAALREAREADRLAQFALSAAQQDVQEWSQQTGYGGYGNSSWGNSSWGSGAPGYGGGYRRGGMSPLGAGLGGLLLGGLLFGGDHDRGDWSSGGWGGGGDWDGGGGDWGGGGDIGGDFGGGDFGGDF